MTAQPNDGSGRFEAANGGTMFLDEVGDLPLEIQVALLRVLQEREIERVGSNKAIPIDVRVIAATHCDLNTLVAESKFRRPFSGEARIVAALEGVTGVLYIAITVALLVGRFRHESQD